MLDCTVRAPIAVDHALADDIRLDRFVDDATLLQPFATTLPLEALDAAAKILQVADA